jgi:hypothetical protein
MIVNTIAKLVPLLLLAVVGLFAINRDYLVIVDWPGLSDFGAATLVLFFAFGGAETALNSSGEIRDPVRTIPRGLLLGVGGIFILYAVLQLVAQGTLGPELANNAEAPLGAAATIVFGSWGTQLLLLGMIVSIFGCLSGDVLNTPRVIFAAARDGLLPGVLATVHPRHHTPHIAILFYAATGCVFAQATCGRRIRFHPVGLPRGQPGRDWPAPSHGATFGSAVPHPRRTDRACPEFRGNPVVAVADDRQRGRWNRGAARSDGCRLPWPRCLQEIIALARMSEPTVHKVARISWARAVAWAARGRSRNPRCGSGLRRPQHRIPALQAEKS